MIAQKRITILGGGASGLFCALILSDGGARDITLLERGERLGRKLSATGNGQGNVTNLHCDARHYFTDDPKKTEDVLRAFPPESLIARLEELGGLFESDEKGRVYPTGRQASAVTDLLRFALGRRKVNVLTEFCVKNIVRKKGEYILFDESGRSVTCDILVVAAGGKAAKNFGTDGTGYELVKKLGHSVTPLYPALVQLKTGTEDIRTLKGIRADCVAYAYDGQRELTHARGDVIFTDYGVSGNAVFFLSSYLTDCAAPRLRLEFLPDTGRERLLAAIRAKERAGVREEELLTCILNNQLGRAILRRVKRECGGVTAERAAACVKDFRLEVTGTLGFDYAQVTRGGVPMREVSDGLESKKSENLYLCGEILNVDGECGGYNLQWAFASAKRAADCILARMEEER